MQSYSNISTFLHNWMVFCAILADTERSVGVRALWAAQRECAC